MPSPLHRFLRGCGLLLFSIFAIAATAGGRTEVLPGPIVAEPVRAVDGDTLEVLATIWLGQAVRILVRLDGIDTPELHGRCAAERRAAEEARELLARLARGPLRLTDVRYDKYGGRVRARVADNDGMDLAGALLRAGVARPYAGDARRSWCDEATRPGD